MRDREPQLIELRCCMCLETHRMHEDDENGQVYCGACDGWVCIWCEQHLDEHDRCEPCADVVEIHYDAIPEPGATGCQRGGGVDGARSPEEESRRVQLGGNAAAPEALPEEMSR